MEVKRWVCVCVRGNAIRSSVSVRFVLTVKVSARVKIRVGVSV